MSSSCFSFAWEADSYPASPMRPPHPRNTLTDFEIPADLDVYFVPC